MKCKAILSHSLSLFLSIVERYINGRAQENRKKKKEKSKASFLADISLARRALCFLGSKFEPRTFISGRVSPLPASLELLKKKEPKKKIIAKWSTSGM